MTDNDTKPEVEPAFEEKYPELVKLKALVDSGEQSLIQRFLDWLSDEPEAHPQRVMGEGNTLIEEIPKEWFIAMRPTRTHDSKGKPYPVADRREADPEPVYFTKEQIMAMFFGIDLRKVSNEKDAMVRELQEAANHGG